MLVTLLRIVTLVRLEQSKNAMSPMVVTLLGIADAGYAPSVPESPVVPMLVTGRPLIVSGIVTVPPGPVYPVMVIPPV